ncbi:hypothetical protein H0H81_008434 [Sphagnurus paluster]|uniref:Uncharacterized protein n=1 Tax=Sphagnurus paluster TaxID=117069 RepID=A0A9P7FV72_9AGAR|nr:hypothetical protein H0H81_008434 [Sphagnurus paluster]
MISRGNDTRKSGQHLVNEQISNNNCARLISIFQHPRFYEHRTAFKSRPARPWTLTAETAASEKRTAPWDPNFQPTPWPDEEDAPGWEEWYYQHAELHYRNEVAGYAHLIAMQGAAIPRFFAAGRLPLAQCPISPRVVLIEYLPDARTLRDVDPSAVELSLAQSLLATARSFAELGFVHADLNLGNILFVPGT